MDEQTAREVITRELIDQPRFLIDREDAEELADGITHVLANKGWSIARTETLAAAEAEVEKMRALIPDDVRALLLEIGRVEWGATEPTDAEGHAAKVRRSVLHTAEHFGQTEPQAMHGLFVEGGGTIVAQTGTSPNSGTTARTLVGAWNYLHDIVAKDAALVQAPTP